MSVLSNLKKNKSSALDELKKKLEEQSNRNSSNSNNDPNVWYPKMDKEKGSGYAVVRLLPNPQQKLPIVKIYNHSFQSPEGKWYIENCLTTIGKPDPCAELNQKLWATGYEEDKNQAKAQKRNARYTALAYVLIDSHNKENEGKIVKYQFGEKIYKKITSKMYPENAEYEQAVDPFCLWEGCNLIIKIKGQKFNSKVVPNYDDSYFDVQSPLHGGDETKLEALMNAANTPEFDIHKLLEPENFKSYDELLEKLVYALGETTGTNGNVPVDPKGVAGKGKQTEKSKSTANSDVKYTAPKKPIHEVDDEPAGDLPNSTTAEGSVEDLEWFKQFQ